MEQTSHPGLTLEEDLPFERRDWLVQRVAWVMMALLILAALLGFLGSGPLSHRTAGQEGSAIWVEYDAFGRADAPADLKVNLGPGVAKAGRARVWLDRQFVDAIDLDHIIPEPLATEASADRLVFVIGIADPAGATAVRFRFQPRKSGRRAVRIGLDGGPAVAFTQFVYP